MLQKINKNIGLLGLSFMFTQTILAQNNTGEIPLSDSRISHWANTCIVQRGWINIADTTLGKTSSGTEQNAVGPVGPSKNISLGDSGVALLSFNPPIKNINGPDFAVFENGFKDLSDTSKSFLEFAIVEVSSDGQNFVRFPAQYTGQTNTQLGSLEATEGKYYHNLAGNYIYGYGTPFDLEELKDSTGIDINNISHVRLVDVVGSIDPNLGSKDANGNMINDPFPTPFPTGGFDLSGIAVLSIPNSIKDKPSNNSTIAIFPNPAGQYITVGNINAQKFSYEILNALGQILLSGTEINGYNIDVSSLPKGLYTCRVKYNNKKCMNIFVKK
ncbi:MAG TPA: T9SS type A sorting domain-containing protein [Edaphocola sp.]|nr:T9SS type A sorting domain-containing protein [Edaphocola sp.]